MKMEDQNEDEMKMRGDNEVTRKGLMLRFKRMLR